MDTVLIEAVRERPEIYDKSCPGYKSPHIKERAWICVGQELNANPRECSTRWNTLRERYCREKRNIESDIRMGVTIAGKYRWPHLEAMNFLSSHIKRRNVRGKRLEDDYLRSMGVNDNDCQPLTTDQSAAPVGRGKYDMKSELNDSTLIEAVRQRPELYDKSNAAFKNAQLKERAWVCVAEVVNANPRECCTRWNTLRERYCREKRNAEADIRSGATTTGRHQWMYMEAMSFLSDHIISRRSLDNFSDASSPAFGASAVCNTTLSSPQDITDSNDSINSESSCESSGLGVKFEETENRNEPVPPPAATSLSHFGNSGRERKRRPSTGTEQLLQDTLLKMKDSFASRPPPSDADALIGKSVEVCLRNTKDSAQKLEFRRRFRQLIQECEENAYL